MKLVLKSDDSRAIGLAAKAFEIITQCTAKRGCHNCRYAYCKNPDTEPDLGCQIEDLEETIQKFVLVKA